MMKRAQQYHLVCCQVFKLVIQLSCTMSSPGIKEAVRARGLYTRLSQQAPRRLLSQVFHLVKFTLSGIDHKTFMDGAQATQLFFKFKL